MLKPLITSGTAESGEADAIIHPGCPESKRSLERAAGGVGAVGVTPIPRTAAKNAG
jgi:hypothetical protein